MLVTSIQSALGVPFSITSCFSAVEFVESVIVEMHTATSIQVNSPATVNALAGNPAIGKIAGATADQSSQIIDPELGNRLDTYSLESIVELKISRVLDHFGKFPPDDLHDLIMSKVEKPLLSQILRRTGGNQVHASRILGINRNTLRKKMKIYGFVP